MTQGEIVVCNYYTTGLRQGAQYEVMRTYEGDPQGRMMRVAPRGAKGDGIYYWAWRFAPAAQRTTDMERPR